MRHLAVTCCGTLALAMVLAAADGAAARTLPGTSVAMLARSAARVFHGRCTRVRVGVAEVGGVRLPVTAYTFRVAEHLKGKGARQVRFRQVGTPTGGARDLGRLVGLPVYAPGADYVLFLLPTSAAGLTSPAGAGEGAFVVRDGQVVRIGGVGGASPAGGARLRAAVPTPSAGDPTSYDDLRRAVRAALRR